MTELTRAITSHDLKNIERILQNDPRIIDEKVQGWFPLEWAERTGNVSTVMRLVRVAKIDYPKVKMIACLGRYCFTEVGNYFGGGDTLSTTGQIWEQIYENRIRPFSKDETEILLGPAVKEDLNYFITNAGIESKETFVELALEWERKEKSGRN